uniref:Synaptotagmin-12 n=1 Tax=Trichuris muris TaxID=70415 RepID=A0A5S6R2U1_TRIMR
MDNIFLYSAAAVLSVACLASLLSLLVQKALAKRNKEQLFGSIAKQQVKKSSFRPATLDVPPIKLTVAPVAINRSVIPTDDIPDLNGRGLLCTPSLDEDAQLAGKWRIWFQLHYKASEAHLEITIFRLKTVDDAGPSKLTGNLFFIVTILPEEELQLQSRMMPVMNAHMFQDTLKVKMTQDMFTDRQVRISMYVMDDSRRRVCCGHTIVKLGLLDFERCETYYFCNELDSLVKVMTKSRGEMHLSLAYDTRKERLTAQVFTARNLPETAVDRKFYMKTIVTVGRRRVKVDCGELCNSLSGTFKCSYSFHIPPRWLQSCSIQFLICELRNTNERRWGHVIVGSSRYAHGSGLEHWTEMINQHPKIVEMWHTIKHG